MDGGRCFAGREGQVNRGTKARAPPLSPMSTHTHTHAHPDLESVSHAGREEGGRLSQHGNGRRGRRTPQVQMTASQRESSHHRAFPAPPGGHTLL